MAQLILSRSDIEADEAARIAAMAAGSPGAALGLSGGPALEADRLARRWVDGDGIDRAEQLSIADSFRGAEGPARFDMVMDRLIAAVKTRALSSDAGQGSDWADLWSRLAELPDRTAAINLDRGDVLAGALADVARVKRMTSSRAA
ncbi:MAG: hypothetical protein EON96_20955 [Caulobacteraceae bacterium]|nr:MAG: hypothetical protein EON96_20955 [Caulobacteraceae bacterium]